MELLTCPQCGSHEFKMDNGIRTCVYCGAQFKDVSESSTHPKKTRPKQARKKTKTNISKDIEDLLAKCEKYPFNAERYARLILSIDPNNTEAKKYL